MNDNILDDGSEECQNLCHQILIKICHIAPGAALSGIENLIIPIDKCIHRQLTQIDKKQEIERASDNLRSVLRSVDALNKIPDVETNSKFTEFMGAIQQKELVKEIMGMISKQNKYLYS